MLDLRFVRENTETVMEAIEKRGGGISLDRFLEMDKERRDILYEAEQLKHRRNVASDKIGQLKREGKDAGDVIREMKEVSSKIKNYDVRLKEIEEELNDIILGIPNIPDESVPVGRDEEDNLELRSWGKPAEFNFDYKAHWELGEELDILDFERGGKVTGTRFTFLKGAAARMEMALINFMLNLHVKEHGYTEIFPPFIVNADSATGTGQLP